MTSYMNESADAFTIKDSGERRSFDSGMVRDTAEGKINYLGLRIGPMLRRWAAHHTKGRAKYPDVEVGVPNWTLAEGPEELERARESAARHFEQWLSGDADEDHAAAVFFNINLAEYVKGRIEEQDRDVPDLSPYGYQGNHVLIDREKYARYVAFATANAGPA